MEQTINYANELMKLALAQGLEVNEEVHESKPKPKYLSPEKLLHHRIVYNMPNKEYHARATSISSSTVKHATTPIMYAKYLEEGFAIKNNACLIIGTALHEMLLEKNARHEYTVYDEQKLLAEVQSAKPETLPENLKRTKEWKSLNALYKNDDGLFLDGVVEKSQFQSIWAMQKKLRAHTEIINLYKGSQSEVSIFCSFEDLEVRCRPDLMKIADETDAETFENVSVGDLIIMSVKTTLDASPSGFARECHKLKYALAEAFYYDILTATFDKRVHIFYLAVEKDAKQILTGQVMLYQCTDPHIARGRAEYEANLGVVIHCRRYPNKLQGYEFHNNNSIILTID